MPSRHHRRFADILINSPAGAHMRARPLPAEVAKLGKHSSSAEGVTFDYYTTTATTFGPLYGPNGNVWFTAGGSVGEFIIASKTIRQCPGLNGLAQEVVADQAGNLWFGMSWGAYCIGRSTTACNVTSYATAGWTNDLVLGPDGNVYFSDNGRKLGRAAPNGTITEFPTTYGTNDPIVGPGNTIWFGEFGPKVGRLSLADNQITEWTVKANVSGSLLATPDGSVWFGTDFVIGRITPQGQVQEYNIGGAGAFNLLYGPDGNVWFGCQYAAQSGKVTPSGQVSLYNINGDPMGMCFGSDNKLYVGQVTYFLSVVDLQGNVTNRPLTGAVPYAPHLGPDNNVWFSGNPFMSPGVSAFIGRIKPDGQLTEFPQSAYPNSFLNGRDGRTMYMGMGTYAFGVVTLT